ncbi:uncharacterized protein N7473_007478 [Penicillium subrubescens]|uniref:uncharacterized protein n=1 Tax=Penicillium subrubescens TaxID=1316194 RepID=UPI0025456D98|nr:uncharacterized protein N7473_007478 [Penicillium subrubescens]KAJ5891250.1 hypothetical protein N7473_007478 [Penicillium subrubescens]
MLERQESLRAEDEPRAKQFKAGLDALELRPAESAVTLKPTGTCLLSSFSSLPFKGYGPNENIDSIDLWIMNGSCKSIPGTRKLIFKPP